MRSRKDFRCASIIEELFEAPCINYDGDQCNRKNLRA